jgi:hypothetical protein
MKEMKHARYTARIIFQLNYSPAKTEARLSDVWWQNPSGYISKNLPFYSSTIRSKPTDFLLLGDTISDPVEFIHYLSNSTQLSQFIMGGLLFFDIDSKDEIPSNYDVGETEEWTDILKYLKERSSVLLTFSATDVPVELTIKNNNIIFQELDWEAIPNRLETSRLTTPKHIFLDKDKFMNEVENCLNWWNSAIKEASKLEKTREEVLIALSCKQRSLRARPK